MPDERRLWFTNRSPYKFPTTLTDGTATTVWEDVYKIAKTMKDEGYTGDVIIRGFFKDVTNKEYLSKSIKVSPDKWLEEKD